MSVTSRLTQLATIERAVKTTTSAGDINISWQTVSENVPCHIQEKGISSDHDEFGQSVFYTATAFFESDIDLCPSSEGEYNDRITVNNTKYLVVGVRKVSLKKNLKEALLRKGL